MVYKGTSAPGTWAWFMGIGLALFIGLTVRSGTFYLNRGRTIDRDKRPALFWLIVGIMVLIVAALFGIGGYELAHVPLRLPPT